ncbi:MAG: hypothetical protein DRO88_00620 [Promethearchaeia archaeon]|nr:MAG: hypothetical protein DRO88_00620 [Candidatus Lokiarchaeia archaeon]
MFKKKGNKVSKKISKHEFVLTALGVMEDETLRPVPADDIVFCLQIDFKQKMKDLQVIELLKEAQNQGYCEYQQNGWKLLSKGEVIVDECLKILEES